MDRQANSTFQRTKIKSERYQPDLKLREAPQKTFVQMGIAGLKTKLKLKLVFQRGKTVSSISCS